MMKFKKYRRALRRLLDRLVSWWNLKQARRAAKKYALDFTVECVFDHQLRQYGYPKNGEICRVAMQSGKAGLYRATITKWWAGGTGQKSWKFEFQGYESANAEANRPERSDGHV